MANLNVAWLGAYELSRRLYENRSRSEGKPFRVRFFDHLRRIVVLFNENDRESWPKWISRSRFSILGQPPRVE